MVVITITVGNKTYIERIPDRQTRVRREPEAYRDIHFLFKSAESLEQYKDHFIYSYLKFANEHCALPDFILQADSMDITVRHEKEK